MSKFFIESDFKAFDKALAKSENPSVIANRNIVVGRLRDLHIGGLKAYMEGLGLYPHWKEKTNLTNVVYPFFKANGGSVTYIRLGYAKNKAKMDEYAKRVGMAQLTDKSYLKDDMAFHYLAQIQLALDENGWDTSFYLGHHGWIEQNNLVKKISNKDNRLEFESILEVLKSDGYALNIGDDISSSSYKKVSSFVDALIDLTNRGAIYTIYIFKHKTVNSVENDKDLIIDYVEGEFTKLLPLYTFVSWSIDNNYIGI